MLRWRTSSQVGLSRKNCWYGFSSQTKSLGCNFEGIKCVDSAGFQVNNACTDNYILCDNGEASPLRPVASIFYVSALTA